jgi:hypothetical protein
MNKENQTQETNKQTKDKNLLRLVEAGISSKTFPFSSLTMILVTLPS